MIGDLRTDGQECWIYCAYIDDKTFMSINRDTVIYIPDIDLNEICDEKRALSNEEIEHILHYCYTIEDFINEAYGNVKAAYSLYMFVDWQNPNINDLRECTDDDEAKEFVS